MTQETNDYAPPRTIEVNGPRKVTIPIVIIAIVLTLLGVAPGYLMGVSKGIGQGGRIGELIGQSIGVVVMAFLVVAIFQIFKRFRNQRSRWKIYCWSIFIVCFSSTLRFLQDLVPISTS